ncbi:peptidoglycan DD-metalloendopeptidase family protein [Yinghuangia soli]|uniref:Peptidoglycan DD-metalloendopeptidase family protein n=1 Tax=Yinghuangia soli TaxID=2908204 RepID=A0AA41PYC1_9ACTN|nr:peptidoglycan DD-metalloendopeptidase family protein [Yinghuangia soli]MCF2526722.1 peptidoglycan DD-metalloendopeptidase family protein [Yinghuangia soli]
MLAIALALSLLTGCTMIWKAKQAYELGWDALGLIFDPAKLPGHALHWASMIIKAGSICPEAPPQLIAAQLYAESSFGLNTNADKPDAAAFGPAQFTPDTWAGHGVDGDGDGDKDIWDPADAIASQGAYDCYLAGVIRHLGGDTQKLMLAAYNAGPNKVLKYSGVPPYNETTNYIRIITDMMHGFTKPPDPGSLGASARAQRVIQVAMEFVKRRVPYLWGGDGPDAMNGVDCSGLTQFAYKAVGIDLDRTAQQQIDQFKDPGLVPPTRVRPGDLVGFDLSGSGGGVITNITHIGLVSAVEYDKKTEKWEITMIQAPKPGDVVKISSVTSGHYGAYNPFFVRVPDSGRGSQVPPGKWTMPVQARYSPTYKASGSSWAKKHTGVDFPVGFGTPVKAVGPGEVVANTTTGPYGNAVVIRHDDGKYTQYAHMIERSPVPVGQRVSGGQQIGKVGSTGNSDGPHLHFEARTGPNYGSDIDPITYLRSKGLNPQPTWANA